MARQHRLSWPVGILIVPFVVLFTIFVCLFTCVALVGAALIGKLTITLKD